VSDVKATLKRLRKEREAQVKAAQAASKAVRAERKRIAAAMEGGPKSVPQIAAAIDMSTDRVLWHIAAMRKYGECAEAKERDGDYFTYELVVEEEQAGAGDESTDDRSTTGADSHAEAATAADAGREG